MPKLDSTVSSVTEEIIQRSRQRRSAYLEGIEAAYDEAPRRLQLPCANHAHSFAASPSDEKAALASGVGANVAIVSAYNDMLSAHAPLLDYPPLIKSALRKQGASAQFAGGVPAMCDGITQGREGMELSLFSRDVIAMSTAIALSHDAFDAVVCLGVCDKIVPGLLIGALHFGHLPTVFIPAGPMPSGLSNVEKGRLRVLHAEGKIDRAALLEGESGAYHAPGTCTFYGTANSNQMLMEAMGLHLPGASFVSPGDPLRRALTQEAATRAAKLTAFGGDYRPLGLLVDERAIVNAIVTLLATGGSTNHTIHLVAIASAAGITVTWEDFDRLSAVVPLLTRIYPNGAADINRFQAVGGTAFLFTQLLEAGLFHEDIPTVFGDRGMAAYRMRPALVDGKLRWLEGPTQSEDLEVVRSHHTPFQSEGGLRLVKGNLGRAIVKVSAVAPKHRRVRAEAIVFDEQSQLIEAFEMGTLERDFVAVLRGQGIKARGMPELHKLIPPLRSLQNRGYQVALVTDGRMSGASGSVPAAIHLSPEAAAGGAIAKIRDGDTILLDCEKRLLEVQLPSDKWEARRADEVAAQTSTGFGRELFSMFREGCSAPDRGGIGFVQPIEGEE